jgi:hypothetical protein
VFSPTCLPAGRYDDGILRPKQTRRCRHTPAVLQTPADHGKISMTAQGHSLSGVHDRSWFRLELYMTYFKDKNQEPKIQEPKKNSQMSKSQKEKKRQNHKQQIPTKLFLFFAFNFLNLVLGSFFAILHQIPNYQTSFPHIFSAAEPRPAESPMITPL